MWQGWINLVIGVWLVISGIFATLQTPINMIIVGILAAIFGFWAYKMWQGIVNGVLGIWVLLSGLAFNLVIPVNFIVVGIVMGALGVWTGLTRAEEMKTKTV